MDEARLSLAREWLWKAKRDLPSARKLADGPDPLLDTAIYHCQQAAEKAAKGFLVFRDERFDKTHDVRLIITQASALEQGFARLLDEADLLTPYATVHRYPDEVLEPTSDEFERAFQAGRSIYRFVLSVQPELLSNGEHGNASVKP